MNGIKNVMKVPLLPQIVYCACTSKRPCRCTISFGLKKPFMYHFRSYTKFINFGKDIHIFNFSGHQRLHISLQRLLCSAPQHLDRHQQNKDPNREQDSDPNRQQNSDPNHKIRDAGKGAVRQKNDAMFHLKIKSPERSIPPITKPLSAHELQFQNALMEAPTKDSFCKVVETFKTRDKTRRGHMKFLSTAMNYLDTFGLEKDLEVYNQLLDVFPRGRFENKTLFDAIWAKQHPQVFLALDILTKMEENVVKPSQETHDICYEVFGRASQPVQKCRRIAYWFTKLEEMFPHPLPLELPVNEIKLSELALERMTKEGIHVKVYSDIADEFILGAQSDNQKEVLAKYDTTKPLYVEGPFFMWLRRLKRYYYILRADVAHKEEDNEGMVLAVCMMQALNQEESLKAWISSLQKENPQLAHINVIFNHQPHCETFEREGQMEN